MIARASAPAANSAAVKASGVIGDQADLLFFSFRLTYMSAGGPRMCGICSSRTLNSRFSLCASRTS